MKILIPLKNRVHAKQRLAPLLSPHQRQMLVCAMLQDMVGQLKRVQGVEIVLLSDDPDGCALASELGVTYMKDKSGKAGDLNAVLQFAVRSFAAETHLSFAIMHADLPCISAYEIERLIAQYESLESPALFIAPDYKKRGTNCLLFKAGQPPKFQFGEDSYLQHCQQARIRSLRFETADVEGLARDIDTPGDLEALVHGDDTHSANNTLTFLKSQEELWRRLGNGDSFRNAPIAEVA